MSKLAVASVVLFLLALFVVPNSAVACTILHTADDSDYISHAALAEYSGVGQVHEMNTSSGGSGTLLSSRWVITAAHVADGASSASDLEFYINGTTYYADDYVIYSGYNSNTAEGDLALVHLSTAVTGVTYASLYDGSMASLTGETATFVGYGYRGDGVDGYVSGTYGTKRAFDNLIDSFGDGYDFPATDIICDFDTPSFALALEGCVAPGDSGGGVFTTIGGETYLIGVSSFIGYYDDEGDADYGDCSGCVCTCAYYDWITSVAVPEPSAVCLLAIAGMSFAFWRRRRR